MAEPSSEGYSLSRAPSSGTGGRFILVSNRVPTPGSPGGLATGLASAISQNKTLWFGWSGKILGPDEAGSVRETSTTTHGNCTYVTIPMSKKAFAGFYLGFSNSYLWPLLHSLVDKIEYHPGDLKIYRTTNKIFAEVLAGLIQPDDIVWIHDYHLIPLGALLKKELARLSLKIKLGFFLHIPFPNAEIFMSSAACDSPNLPNSAELNMLLQAFTAYDLIGVQTSQDAQHLNDLLVERGFKKTARAFPIAIDPVEVLQEATDNEAKARKWVEKIIPEFKGKTSEQKKLVIGVDRLDYTKGIPERLRALELMLRRYPNMRQEYVFLQISAVSRAEVKKYKLLEMQVSALFEIIGSGFNEKAPVVWHKTAVPRSIVEGLCRLAQVALITPLADGMNLVAKEFVAAQRDDNPGVLVLSQYAGAAEELGGTDEAPGAMVVDPYNAGDIAKKLHYALNMDLEERQARWRRMNQNVQTNTAATWSTGFVDALKEAESYLEATQEEEEEEVGLVSDESYEDLGQIVADEDSQGWYFSRYSAMENWEVPHG